MTAQSDQQRAYQSEGIIKRLAFSEIAERSSAGPKGVCIIKVTARSGPTSRRGIAAAHFEHSGAARRVGGRRGGPRRCKRAYPKEMKPDHDHAQRLLDRIGALQHPCDLDLLIFFARHPRTLLASEQLAVLLGYEFTQLAASLDLLVGAGCVDAWQRSLTDRHRTGARARRCGRGDVGHDPVSSPLGTLSCSGEGLRADPASCARIFTAGCRRECSPSTVTFIIQTAFRSSG